MHLVVGLGNPGKKYAGNRHNVGFLAIDELRARAGLAEFREKFSGVWTKGPIGGRDAALLKPMTFMNVSGDSLQPAAAFLKVSAADIVVLHDELDVPFGEVRLKVGGGHAGHNGLRSIIQRLGTPDFVRVRIGVGRPPPGFRGDVADYVLSDFDASERAELPDILGKAIDATLSVLKDGVQAAQTATNARAQVRNSSPKPAATKGTPAPQGAGAKADKSG